MRDQDKTKAQLIDELALLRVQHADSQIVAAEVNAKADAVQSQEALRAVLEASPDLMMVVDPEGHYRAVFTSQPSALVAPTQELIGKSIHEIMPAKDARDIQRVIDSALASDDVQRHEYALDVQGGRRWFSGRVSKLTYQGAKCVLWSARDVTEHRIAEDALRVSNRALRVHTRFGQTLTVAMKEGALLDETCRVMIEEGGYLLAWIGFAEHDEHKTVRVVAAAGHGSDYVNTLSISWDDTVHGRGPTGLAIRTGRPCAARHILTDPEFAPWRDAAVERGYSSSVALPLVAGGDTFGALNVYSAEADAFDDAEQSLLVNLANDVAYGIAAMREKENRRRIERALTASEKKHRVHQMASEQALRSERDRAQMFLDVAGVGLVLLDVDGTVALVNRKGCEILECSPADAVGRNWFTDFLPEKIQSPMRAFFAKQIAGEPENGMHYEGVVVTLAGSQKDIWYRTAVTRSATGEIDGVLFSAEDVTARNQAERERLRLEEQLQQSQKLEAMGTLAGGVAHDMNNVLAVVLGLGSVLQAELPVNSTGADDARQIIAAARRGKSMVENLLGFARKGAFENAQIAMNETVEGLVEMLSHSIPKKIAVVTALNSDLELVECDVARFTQTLMNLCLNASDALDGVGTITISTSNVVLGAGDVGELPAGAFVNIRIEDDGPGMDEATRLRAFEPFFTTKDVGKGTGLGLSLAYGAVRACGGAIEIESSMGVGTAVSIWMPAARPRFDGEDSHGEVGEEEPQAESRQPRGKVLLVDDEVLVRTTAERMIKVAGYDVVVAGGAVEALDVYRKHRRDIGLVVLDLSMPLMDGAECFDKLKEIDSTVRVLICSGHGEPAITNEMLSKGVLAILAKPYSLEEVTETIDRLWTDELS